MLVSWDVAITIITEGNLGPAEEVREASHEGALMPGSDRWCRIYSNAFG